MTDSVIDYTVSVAIPLFRMPYLLVLCLLYIYPLDIEDLMTGVRVGHRSLP